MSRSPPAHRYAPDSGPTDSRKYVSLDQVGVENAHDRRVALEVATPRLECGALQSSWRQSVHDLDHS